MTRTSSRKANAKPSKKSAPSRPKKKSRSVSRSTEVHTATTPRSQHGVKAEFIRSRPTLAVEALIERGRAQGISLTEGTIYNVRSIQKRKAMTEFVLARPRMAVPKLITLGLEHDYNLTSSFIEGVRANESRKSRQPPARTSAPVIPLMPGVASTRDLEHEFRATVLRIGVVRAQQIIQGLMPTDR